MIKFIKDETVKSNFDVYKSHTVHVPSGEPPGSLSRPPAKRKAGVVRPITQGKLLKGGAPNVGLSLLGRSFDSKSFIQMKPQATSRSKPTPQPIPGGSANRQPPVVSSSDKLPPRVTIPPPPPKKSAVPAYRAKFAFEGQDGEMSLQKDDIVELIEKDDNGWWLVRMNGAEGWAPHNYLELVQQSAPAPPAVPPPPRKAPPPKLDNTPSAATAKPASVFPGTVPGNGSAKLRKMPPSKSDANSRPPNPLASKAPPPVAAKPKPPVGAKPPVGKPTIPTASGVPPAPPPPPPPPALGAPAAPAARRPPASNVKSSASKFSGAPGQVDLAAAVSFSSSGFFYFSLPLSFISHSSRSVLKERRMTDIQMYPTVPTTVRNITWNFKET